MVRIVDQGTDAAGTGAGSDASRGDTGGPVTAVVRWVLLSSYMLRILTVSKHSLESTVFTLESDDDPGFDR